MGRSPKRARTSAGRRTEDGVGAGRDLLVAGELEEVGERATQADEALVDVDEDDQAADDGRIADPAGRIEPQPGDRVSDTSMNSPVRVFVGGSMMNGGSMTTWRTSGMAARVAR